MWEHLARVPAVETLRGYDRARAKQDVGAALAVLAVLIPQGLAYGSVAGLEPVAGYYAAIGGMVGFALFSRGRVMVGPESTTSAMSAAAIASLALGQADRAAQLSTTLALLVGIGCLLISLCRLGFAAELLSRPVLFGYLAGVSIIVIVGQLPKLFGIPSSGSNIFAIGWNLIVHMGSASVVTLVFGLVLLVANVLLSRLRLPVPAPLIVVVVATAATAALGLADHGVAVMGEVAGGVPLPSLPSLRPSDITDLIPSAIGISFVAFADSSAWGRSYASKHHEPYPVDHEIASLGVANVAASTMGGFVVSSSGSRTAVADESGLRTQITQIVAAVGMGAVLLVFTPLLTDLPQVALAAVVISTTARILSTHELVALWNGWRSEAALAVVTLVAVASLGILPGLAIAVLLALLNLVRISARPHDAVLALDEDEATYRDGRHLAHPEFVPGVLVYRVDAPLFFANVGYVSERLERLIRDASEPVRYLVLDAEAIFYVDSTATAALAELVDDLASRDIRIVFARMKSPVRARFGLTELADRIGPESYFRTVRSAVRAHLEGPDAIDDS